MEQLGIQPGLLLAQVFNFGLIIFILSKLLFKPILGMLDKRKKEIEEGLALTEKIRLEEEKFKERQEKLLEKARSDARKILDEARHNGKEEEKVIIAESHDQAARILEKAKAEILIEREMMQKSVRAEAVDLAVAMTQRLTAAILTPKDQHKLISGHLRELAAVKSKQ
jgi:F-type H+-transporting ATPase subunit b